MKSKTVFIFLFLSSIVFSCATPTSKELPDTKQDINLSITLTAPPQINTLKLNDFIGIVVQNNTKHRILLSFPEALTITKQENDSRLTRISIQQEISGEILISPQSDKDLDFAFVDMIPVIPTNEKTSIKITITCRDQTTSNEVSAYIDLTLTP